MAGPAQPRTILHVGNVANNAYVNAKLLNDFGYVSHVAAYDYYHFASTGEWQEVGAGEVPPSLLGNNDYYPNFWALGDLCPPRPRWFAQGPQYLVIEYLRLLAEGRARQATVAWSCLQYARFKAVQLEVSETAARRWPEDDFQRAVAALPLSAAAFAELAEGRLYDRLVERVLDSIARAHGGDLAARLAPPFDPRQLDQFLAGDPALRRSIERLRDQGLSAACGLEYEPVAEPPPPLPDGVRVEDVASYGTLVPFWRRLFRLYDMIILYGTDPLLGLLAGCRRYIAYEHGTIRSIPFEDSALGRLTRLGYERAAAVFVTNADYVTADPRLEFEPGRLFYMPHAFDERPLWRFAQQHAKPRPSRPVRFVAPARHDWLRRDPKWSKGNDIVIRAMAELRRRGVDDFQVRFIEWGCDLDESRRLIEELGVSRNVAWLPPLPKGRLWEEYLMAHGVIDQFLLSAFGGVTFEALAFGCRVITRDDGICNREFFGESPPLLGADTPDGVADRMAEVIADPDDRAGQGERIRAWVERYHSGSRIVAIQRQAFATVLGQATLEPVPPPHLAAIEA